MSSGRLSVKSLGCKNPAAAGPFGGCAAVQMGSGNSTAAARKRAARLGEYKRRGIFAGLEG